MIRMEEMFKLVGKFADLQSPEKVREEIVELEQGITENEIVDMAEERKTDLFGRIFKPRPEEVKRKIVRKYYMPCWYLTGSFECKWLNITDYPVPVPEDVEAIKIGDKVHTVRKEALKISDMLERIGIGIGIGPISVPAKGVSIIPKLLRMDKVLGADKHLLLKDIVELREDKVNEKICIDANDGEEDEEALKLIEKAHHKKTKERAPPKIKREWAIEEFWNIKFKEIHKGIESEAEGIIERNFKIEDLRLVLIPQYEVTFIKSGKTKSWSICAVDGTMKKR